MSAPGLARRLRARLIEPPRPEVAVELRPRSLGVVRVQRRNGAVALAGAALIDLQPGILEPSLVRPNVLDGAAFEGALRAAMERAGVAAGTRVALVLPDPAARVTVFPGADLVGKARREADEMLRFRLRKGVPFEVRGASLAFELEPPGPGRPARALVAAMAREVLDGFESPLRAVGLEPGLVEVAALALLRAAGATAGDELFVNWDDGFVSFVLTQAGVPALVRTLQPASAADVTREAASTLVYHRERLGGQELERVVLRAAAAEADPALLARAVGSEPQLLDAWRGLAGAPPGVAAPRLAGAAAVLLESRS